MNINAKNVSTLIHFMEGLNDPRFRMSIFFHKCGAPACALGHGAILFHCKARLGQPLKDFGGNTFGTDSYWHLFNGLRNARIVTPQQWATHARNFLTDNGFEVTELIKNAAPQGTTTPASTSADGKDPAVAAPDAFKVFMGKVLEDAQVKQGVIAAEAVSGVDERNYP